MMINKNVFSFLLLSFFLSAFSFNIFPAQERSDDSGIFVVKSEDGYLFVNNQNDVFFTIEFKGERIEPLESKNISFLIDERFIQIVLVPRDDFLESKSASKPAPNVEELLQAHKIWERDYLSETLNTKLFVTEEAVKISSGRKALFWHFPMPASIKASVTHQLFLTTNIGENVLAINGTPNSSFNIADYRAYMIKALATVQISDKPFNIEKITESLKSNTKAG